jgi:hypothetical protein
MAYQLIIHYAQVHWLCSRWISDCFIHWYTCLDPGNRKSGRDSVCIKCFGIPSVRGTRLVCKAILNVLTTRCSFENSVLP